MTVNIGLRRQAMQLQHFTDGNVPPGLLTAPDGWNVEQIRQFQEWFDSVLAGNTGARSRLVWGPSGAKYQAFKEPPYKDEFDEWLARIVCYAFSLPPSAFTRQVNRATAETAQEAALAEGLAPLMGWVKRLADHVIQSRMGHPDLEFTWLDSLQIAPKEQAEILAIYVKEGIKTRNEARDLLGDDPLPGGDSLLVDTAQGPVRLDAVVVGGQATAKGAVSAYGKEGFDPDQPRVPAGNPDGGQWTGDGGGDSAGSSHGGDAVDPGAGDSTPQDANSGRVWERFPNADFRNRLAVAEQTADKGNFGYGEVNARSGALGRYQMTPDALRAAGMIGVDGNWTGKYGVHSAVQFLASPEAQERALTDFLNDTWRQLHQNGAIQYLGRSIDGRRDVLPVTLAGLIAAAHREGAPATRDYLQRIEEDGFRSRGQALRPRELRVETRLRTFSRVPYE